MQENKAATTGHDKDKGFALLRTDTIQLWVWLQGYQPLDEQPLKSISEDISYRIRESSDVIRFIYILIFPLFLKVFKFEI